MVDLVSYYHIGIYYTDVRVCVKRVRWFSICATFPNRFLSSLSSQGLPWDGITGKIDDVVQSLPGPREQREPPSQGGGQKMARRPLCARCAFRALRI